MAKVLTGSKASIKLNGLKIAFVGSVTVNHENTLQDIDVLDQLPVAEHAEVGHRVSFSCNLFKVDENAANVLGLEPRNLDDLLTQGELVMEIYDRIADTVRYEMTGVKWEGGSGTIDARGVWQGTWNFRGKVGFGM